MSRQTSQLLEAFDALSIERLEPQTKSLAFWMRKRRT
jgi:hypothetical protein